MPKIRDNEQSRARVLLVRAASGAVVIAISFVTAFYGGWILFLTAIVSMFICLDEFYKVLALKGYRPILIGGVLIGATFIIDAQIGNQIMNIGLIGAAVGLILVPAFTRYKIVDWALTVYGALYIGLLLSYAIIVRALPQGSEWLLMVFWGVGAAEIVAYVVGTAIGKHKLAPRISPGKTWEGFIGGALGCVLTVMLLNLAFHLLLWPSVAFFGVILAVAELIGDLWASVVKRYAEVKDYSGLIPGHGGLLDRFDGLILSLPVGYLLILLLR